MTLATDWIPFGRGVRVVATHECGLIAVEKPDGILSHPNPGEVAEKGTILITGNYSLDEESFHVRDGKGGIRRVYLLNRLDSPTSGVLLLSLDVGVADVVRKMFARSQVSKQYVALIRGRGERVEPVAFPHALSLLLMVVSVGVLVSLRDRWVPGLAA